LSDHPATSAALTTRALALTRDGRAFTALPDLEVRRGRSLALLGPSGSGKTTALMALAGIRAPGSGEVMIEDTALWTLSSVERDRFRGRRIGLVFQSFHLIEAVGVAANLRLAASCAGLRPDAARVRGLLDSLGIGQLHDKPADRISHGQAQRVAVARALVNRPAVVLADEPTSALDDASASQLLTLLKETAASEGAGLIIATHDRRVIDAVDETVELRPTA